MKKPMNSKEHVTSSEGGKCIEIEDAYIAGGKVIEVSITGGKVVDVSEEGGKVVDSSLSTSVSPSHTKLWVILIIFLIISGCLVGYYTIEEQERQARMEDQYRYEQQQTQKEAEQKQREAEKRIASQMMLEAENKAQKENARKQRKPKRQLTNHEVQRSTEDLVSLPGTTDNSKQQNASPQYPSQRTQTKNHYQGHMEITTKQGMSKRIEYDGYYTEEEIEQMRRDFMKEAFPSTE